MQRVKTLYGLFQSVLNLQKSISSYLAKNAFSPKTFLMGTHSSDTVTKNIITDSCFLSLNLIKVAEPKSCCLHCSHSTTAIWVSSPTPVL